MQVAHFFAGLAVADGERARVWYERLFGRPADMTPREDEWVWRLSEGASVYAVVDSSHAGGCRVTVALHDLEAELSALEARGIAFARRPPAGQQPPSAVLVDPDGNSITLFGAPRQP